MQLCLSITWPGILAPHLHTNPNPRRVGSLEAMLRWDLLSKIPIWAEAHIASVRGTTEPTSFSKLPRTMWLFLFSFSVGCWPKPEYAFLTPWAFSEALQIPVCYLAAGWSQTPPVASPQQCGVSLCSTSLLSVAPSTKVFPALLFLSKLPYFSNKISLIKFRTALLPSRAVPDSFVNKT